MSLKSKIPQVIYTHIAPVIQAQKRIKKINSLFGKYTNKEKGEEVAEQEGRDEHVKNIEREKEDAKTNIDKLIKKSNRKIISIDSFSFIPSFFKNTIEVEESRIIFIFKQPFTFQTHSVDIVDISNVFIESAFLFAKMQIVSRTFTQNDITIGYLDKQKAEKVRKIIEGLRTFARSKIDTSVYETDELVQKLEELYQQEEKL